MAELLGRRPDHDADPPGIGCSVPMSRRLYEEQASWPHPEDPQDAALRHRAWMSTEEAWRGSRGLVEPVFGHQQYALPAYAV